jgi:hypothetical protein
VKHAIKQVPSLACSNSIHHAFPVVVLNTGTLDPRHIVVSRVLTKGVDEDLHSFTTSIERQDQGPIPDDPGPSAARKQLPSSCRKA